MKRLLLAAMVFASSCAPTLQTAGDFADGICNVFADNLVACYKIPPSKRSSFVFDCQSAICSSVHCTDSLSASDAEQAQTCLDAIKRQSCDLVTDSSWSPPSVCDGI